MDQALQLSKKLKLDAEDLLSKKGIHAMLAMHGEVMYVGSYELDLMIWKDIDLNIIVEPGRRDRAAKEIVSSLLDIKEVTRIKVFRDLRKKYGSKMPDSVYIGVKVLGWKLDIHVVYEDQAKETREKTEKVRDVLTPEASKKIVLWKSRLLEDSGRTPKFSGMHLYDAILVHRLENDEEVLNYLRENGVSV